MKIMLVEDDYLLNKTIKNYFKDKNIVCFRDADTALKQMSNYFDVFLICIDVPKINGIELLKNIKDIYNNAHIIIISETIEIEIIEKAYSFGCNDYIKKPFDIKELELKLNLLEKNEDHKYTIDKDLYYDTNTSQLFYKEDIINLTIKESKLLHLLMTNRGRIVTTETIIYHIWETSETNQSRQLISRLKKKLPIDCIQNRVGQGYIIE